MRPKRKSSKTNMSPEEQKKLFNLVMENIKGYSTCKAKKEMIGIVTVDLSLLYIDDRYQGLRKHKKLCRLINNWDERKLGAIVIVPHPEEYRFAVVDGQGRVSAAKELGYETLQAIVLLNAPEDKIERLKFEAEIFIGQDNETERVKPLEKHPARVIIGDETALALEKILTKYNISYTDSKGSRQAGVLGSYPTTYKMAKVHGYNCLDFVFSIIYNAGWNMESNGYATFVTESLKEIWVQYFKDRDVIFSFLSEELRNIDPTSFSLRAKTTYPLRKDLRNMCTLYLEDIIYTKLGIIKTV